MSFSEALNGGLTILFAGSALATSFFLPAEVSVILLVASYSTAVYAIGLMTGNRGGNPQDAIGFFWKLVLLTVTVFTVIYWRYGLMHQNEHVQISMLDAAYFSVTTLTTLGYGDFAPIPRIRHITSIEAILGYIALGLWVGLINKQITGFDEMRQQINRHNSSLLGSSKVEKSVEDE